MNSLQLFRIYRSFMDMRDDTESQIDRASPHVWTKWKKWNRLARMTQKELEKRLEPRRLLPKFCYGTDEVSIHLQAAAERYQRKNFISRRIRNE